MSLLFEGAVLLEMCTLFSVVTSWCQGVLGQAEISESSGPLQEECKLFGQVYARFKVLKQISQCMVVFTRVVV